MEKEFQKDNMEQFFRKAFGELGDVPSDDGWDTPSDGVWAGIQHALPGPRPAWWASFRLWAGALLAGGLLICLFSGLWLHYRGLESKIEQQALANERLQLAVDSLHRQLARQENDAASDLTIENKDGKEKITGHTIGSSINKRSGAAVPASFLEADAPARTQEDTREAARSLPAVAAYDGSERPVSRPETKAEGWFQHNEQPDTGSPLQEQPQMAVTETQPAALLQGEGLPAGGTGNTSLRGQGAARLAPLPGLVILDAQVVSAARQLAIQPGLGLIEPARMKPGFYVGAYTAWNYTSRDLSSNAMGADQPVRPIFEAQEQGQGSMEFGVRAGLQLSRRWALESGLGTFSIRQQSRQLFRITFDPNRERPDGAGVLESTYALAVPSAYGDSQIEVDLRRAAAQQILPGEAIGLEVSSQQQIRFVSIPLAARYELLSGRFRLGVKGGVAINFLQATALQTAVQLRRSGLRAPATRVRQRFSEIRDTNLDYILGLSVRYRLWPGLEAALEPAYRRNLQPVTDRQDFRTHSYALGLQLGLNYHF